MDGILHRLEPCDHRLCVHGLAAQIVCDVPRLNWPIHHALGEFDSDWPEGFTFTAGRIETYDEDVVMRHLSPEAVPVARSDLMEVYEHGDRFWIVDDRWGLAEINLLKNAWQSWVVPEPAMPLWQVAEAAVVWPLAQLLRQRGLTLVPSASVECQGFGALILSPFGIEPELTALSAAGWNLVGQRWTALREEDDRISMLRMPGQVERLSGPRFGGADNGAQSTTWIDLTQEWPGASRNHAFCDAVIVVDAARRGAAKSRAVKASGTAALLKKAWPIFDLHIPARHTHMPLRVASKCAIMEAQLSRRASDFVSIMEKLRLSRPSAPPMPARIESMVARNRQIVRSISA